MTLLYVVWGLQSLIRTLKGTSHLPGAPECDRGSPDPMLEKSVLEVKEGHAGATEQDTW